MAFADGDPFISGTLLSYQQANRMKDHWNAAAAPMNPQGGMLYSNSADDVLKHYGANSAAWIELLQAGIPFSGNINLDDDVVILFGGDEDECMGYMNAGDIWHLCDGNVLGNNIRMSINGTGISVNGVAPVAQQAHIPDARGPGDVVYRLNDVIHALENFGITST